MKVLQRSGSKCETISLILVKLSLQTFFSLLHFPDNLLLCLEIIVDFSRILRQYEHVTCAYNPDRTILKHSLNGQDYNR